MAEYPIYLKHERLTPDQVAAIRAYPAPPKWHRTRQTLRTLANVVESLVVLFLAFSIGGILGLLLGLSRA